MKIDAITDNSVEIINKEGKKVSILSDKILVATGRKPNTAGLGLENTNIQLGQRGEIVVNDKLETTVQNVWALGDVHGGLQFTYTSLDDFRIVSNNLYGDGKRSLSDRKMYQPLCLSHLPCLKLALMKKLLKQRASIPSLQTCCDSHSKISCLESV